MNGRYALDTNIVIALIGGEKSIRDRISAADEVFIPSPVLGELYFGAFNSTHPDENVACIDDLARSYAILTIGEATAKTYGILRRDLRASGKPIPNNDIWVAAAAQLSGATVATRDEHFLLLTGVAVEMW